MEWIFVSLPFPRLFCRPVYSVGYINWLSALFMVFHQLKVMLVRRPIVLFAQGTHLLSIFFTRGLSGALCSFAVCWIREWLVMLCWWEERERERWSDGRDRICERTDAGSLQKDGGAFVLSGSSRVSHKTSRWPRRPLKKDNRPPPPRRACSTKCLLFKGGLSSTPT